jgi:hypothetical protein
VLGARADARAARGARARGEYAASMYEQDANYALDQSADAYARGEEGVQQVVLSQREMVGEQRAAFAGQGVDVGAGGDHNGTILTGSSGLDASGNATPTPAKGTTSTSVQDVIIGDQVIGQHDMAIIRANAAREARGYHVQSDDFLRQAQLARMGGANEAASYRSREYSTLLTGASDLFRIGLDTWNSRDRSVVPRSGAGASSANGGYRNGTARY